MAEGVRQRVEAVVATLPPGAFAVVMATGIVSVGLHLRGLPAASAVLLWLALVTFAVLVVLTGWRLLTHRAALVADLADPRRGFGVFTLVAAANVLGVRLAVDGHYAATAVLLVVAGLCWLVPGHLVPWAIVLGWSRRRSRRGSADPPVLAAVNGTWFLWAVASQSIAVASATLQPVAGGARTTLSVVAIVAWSIGGCLYVGAGLLVAIRLLLFEVVPAEFNPSYWVAMGASAITVLAGSRIVEMADAPIVDTVRGLVAGASVVFWAFASWLFPLLLAAGWWRHRVHRVPFSYDSSLWAMVFPLGMYAVSAISLGEADRLPVVRTIGGIELWVAVVAWLVVFAAMVDHVTRTVLLGRPPRTSRARLRAETPSIR